MFLLGGGGSWAGSGTAGWLSARWLDPADGGGGGVSQANLCLRGGDGLPVYLYPTALGVVLPFLPAHRLVPIGRSALLAILRPGRCLQTDLPK